MPHKPGHKEKDPVIKRTITATGEDITGLSKEERTAAIAASGFVAQQNQPGAGSERTPTAPARSNVPGRQTGQLIERNGTVFNVAPSELAATQQQVGQTKFVGAQGSPLTAQQEAAQMQREGEVAGLLETGIVTEPERTQLDIEREGFAATPVVGPGAAAIENILINAGRRGLFGDEFAEFIKGEKGEQPLITDPETAREFALQEIQKEVIAEGLTASEDFGALIETIPVVGKLVSTYASGLIETPAGNAQTIKGNILNEKERALNIAEMVRSGRLDPNMALDRLEELENNIFSMEQRIKLLALSSPILRADADTLNQIETEILRAKERVEDARTSALQGKLKDSTDAEIFSELNRLKKNKSGN